MMTTSSTPRACSISSAWSAMSVLASTSGSVTRIRATSRATLPTPTTTARPLEMSGAISSKCGCALYQPTKSTAATLPGSSSPGMFNARSDCAPTA